MGLLAAAIANGGEEAETERTLFHLSEYVDFHFKAEEDMMVQTSYLGLEAHRAVHDEMRSQVKALVDSYLEEHKILPASLMDYLISWLIEHMDGEDRKLAGHLRKGPGYNQGASPL